MQNIKYLNLDIPANELKDWLREEFTKERLKKYGLKMIETERGFDLYKNGVLIARATAKKTN